MTRRTFMVASAVSAAALQAQQPKPNVVIILTDDQGWFDVKLHGNPYVRTPNMDSVARDGVHFPNFYASPVCSPTRSALMTGRHFQRTGAVDTYKGRDVLSLQEVTMGQVFRDAGYRTACVGKWHLGRYMKYHPNNRGFDEYFGFWQYGFMNRYDDSDELFDNKTPVEVTGYITDVLTDRALTFIQQNKSRPYLLYLPYNAPHSPYLVPDRYIAPMLKEGVPLEDARIYGMVNCLDDNIGRVLAAVDKENTIVIFMSDNGGVSHFFKAGLRGNKGTCYEGGVRVPFYVRWPGKLPAGTVQEAMAQHIDVLPTLCELTGVKPPAKNKLDGKSLVPLLKGETKESPHRYLFHQWNRGHPVKTTVPGDPELKASWAVRDAAGWKLLATGELFNLQSDPGEQKNIASSNEAKVRELQGEFDRFFADVTAGKAYQRVPIEIGRPDENPVEIDLTWAEPIGKHVEPTYRHYNRDTVEKWDVEGEGLRWKVDVTQAGDYEVILKYGCEPGQEGSRLRMECGTGKLEHVVQPTAGRMMFETFHAGKMTMTAGPAELRFLAASLKGPELMALHKIFLRRV